MITVHSHASWVDHCSNLHKWCLGAAAAASVFGASCWHELLLKPRENQQTNRSMKEQSFYSCRPAVAVLITLILYIRKDKGMIQKSKIC